MPARVLYSGRQWTLASPAVLKIRSPNCVRGCTGLRRLCVPAALCWNRQRRPLQIVALAGAPPVPPQVPHPAVQPPIASATPTAQPVFSSYIASAPEDSRSLESRIGSQWFNPVGILAVLIGMAWFLKLAIDNQWIDR